MFQKLQMGGTFPEMKIFSDERIQLWVGADEIIYGKRIAIESETTDPCQEKFK